MTLPKNVRCAWGPALAAALAFGAAAQTAGAGKQLAEGRQLRAEGRYAEAREAFLAALRDTEKAQPDSLFMALVLDNLGIDENDLGNYPAAERDFNRALAILSASAADDPAAAAVKTHLAELYLAERRPSDAEPLLRQAAAGLRSAARPDRVALAVAENGLGIVYTMQHKYRQAETVLREALSLLETALSPGHPVLTASLNPLTALLLAERRYAEAVVPAERALHILQSPSLSVAKPDLAGVLAVLGLAYSHAGHAAEAESCARQAVALAEEVYGPENPRLGLFLATCAATLRQIDRKSQAKEVQKRADAILAQRPRANSGADTVSVNAMR